MSIARDEDRLQEIEEATSERFFGLAAELARRYVTTFPDDLEGFFHLGKCFYNLNLYAAARRTLEAILPNCSDATRPLVLTQLATVCNDMGDLVEAKRYYVLAIEVSPADAECYTELASIYRAEGHTAEAEGCLRKGLASQAFPSQDLLLPLGEILCANNALKEALECFRKILEADPENEDAAVAVEDIERLAKLRGMQLALPAPPPPETGGMGAEEEGTETPGKMTANLHRKFFADIAAKRKKIEYRAFSPHWQKRIFQAGRPPFHLRLINGMLKNAPELTVVVERVLLNFWEGEYELHLGEIIDVRNWDLKTEKPSAEG